MPTIRKAILNYWERKKIMTYALHGGDIYSHKVNLDFSVSVNPLGMPDEVREAAIEGVRMSEHYPDIISRDLIRSISSRFGVLAASVLVGNGSDELIYAFCRAIRPLRIMTDTPTFTEYERAAACPWTPYADEANLICLCNPNNPTGTLRSKEELMAITESAWKRGTFVLIDESFLPFTNFEEETTMLKETEHYPNLIVLRSFTKLYAMPGLRLGWAAIGSTHVREKMSQLLQPWNVSIPAQKAGQAALALKDYENRTRAFLAKERPCLFDALSALPMITKVCRTEANYIYFAGPKDLDSALLKQGILIRSCRDMRGADSMSYRAAIRTHADNSTLISALAKSFSV